MDLQQAQALALTLMEKHGLLVAREFISPWRFSWNNKKRVCGICWHGRRIVELSRAYVQHNSEELVRNTILHEIAHALVGPDAGHGPVWKLKAMEIGAKPETCNKGAVIPGKYQAVCPGCSMTHHLHRLPKQSWYGCGRCKRQTGHSVEISFERIR